jgi:RNase H-fold protein (predicted Holliday junction resolvase)
VRVIVAKKKKAALIDKVAAVIILQGYLDNRNYNQEEVVPL